MTIEQIKNICAVGAGAMGSTTALCFAMTGYDVKLYDLTDASVEGGLKNIQTILEAYVEHNIIQKADIAAILGRIKTTTSLEDAAKSADFIIESIVENLAIKQKVFANLDKICPAHTVFGTNTSGLSPTKIAEAIQRKDKFVVTHFWNPAHLIPLVEVVPGKHTSQQTVDIAYQLMHKIGKKPVSLKKESLGFVGNRIQAAIIREALHIVTAGIASAEDVDAVVRYSLGRRLAATGPIESIDLGGLDVFQSIFSYLGPDLSSDPGIPQQIDMAVKAGDLGAKTGKGIYSWSADKLADLKTQRIEELFRHLENDLKNASTQPAGKSAGRAA
jgi:3-hydroxybutyryl-CoA dehydrogenase